MHFFHFLHFTLMGAIFSLVNQCNICVFYYLLTLICFLLFAQSKRDMQIIYVTDIVNSYGCHCTELGEKRPLSFLFRLKMPTQHILEHSQYYFVTFS